MARGRNNISNWARQRREALEEVRVAGRQLQSYLESDGHGRYILGAKGEPELCPDLMKWGRWMGVGNRQVLDSERGGVRVSTVFLGLDHAFGGGPPVLWETMVFGGEMDGEQERYRSEAAAITGHEMMKLRVEGCRPQVEA